MQKRKRKQESTRVNAAGVETMESSESTQEEKYKILVQNIPCAVYSAYPEKTGPTTFMSNKWKDWTGYSPEELYHDPEAWPRCIHRDDREHAVNTYIQACRDRTAYNLEYRIIHKDTGQLRYVRDEGHLSKDEKGVVVRVDGIITDITELKKANNELDKCRNYLEEQVRERTAELTSVCETLKVENKGRKRTEQALCEVEREKTTVLENLSDLIVYRDRDMVTLWASKSMANWHGMSQDQIVGRICYKARYGRDEPCEECHVIEAMKSGKRQDLEKQFSDGRCWHVIVNPVLDDSGQVIGTIEVSQDITERKRADQALHETTNLLETILEHTHMLVACLDPQFNFVQVNRAYAEADERQPSFFHGKNHFDLYPSEENEVIFRRVIETGIPYFTYAKPFEYAEHPERGISYWDWSLVPIKNQQGIVSDLVLTLADVTARKRAEESLKASEGKLNAMLQSISDHMSMMDKDLNILWANDMATRMFGDDIIGKKCYEVYHGRQNPCEPFPCLTLKAFQDGKVHEHDTQVVDKDGNTRYFHCNANVALRDLEGKSTAVLEISRDVTDQKRVEQALRKSENSYRAVVENAAEGIIVAQDQTLQFVNPAALSMFGYSKEELLTRPFIEFIHPDHRDWTMGIHIKRLKGEEVPLVYELKVLDKKGNTIWLENNGILIEWGDKPATLNFLRDVTERKKAEQAIWASESEKRGILNAISDNIIFHDTDLTIRWGNEAAARSIGMTQRELVGCHCYELWQGRSEPCERCPVIGAIETGSHTEGIMTTPDRKWWEIIGEPVLDRDGQIRGAIEISRDITERVLAEKALQESEERFRAIYENALVGLYRTTPDGRILMANPALVQMLGYSSFEELAQLNLEEEGYSRDYQRSVFKERVEAEDRIDGLESRWMRRDGTTLFVRESARAVRDKDGEILYYEGTVADITERKKVEEELRIREQQLRALLNAPTESAMLVDTEGTILDVNRIAAQRLGKSVESLIGMGIYDYLPADIAEYRKNQGYEVIRSGKSVRFQNEREGHYYDTNIYPVFDDEGKVSSLAVFSGDITERRRAEEALGESEEKFRSLAEQSPNMIFINKKGRVVYANKKCEEVMGYTREEFCSPDFEFRTLIDPGSLGVVRDSYTRHSRGEEIRPYDYCLINKKGERIEAINASKLIQYEGETAILDVVTDITERKRAEQALCESEERLKILFESAPDTIYLIDSEGRFVDANRAAMELIGFAKDEMIGKSLAELGLLSTGQLSKAKINLKKAATAKLSGPNEYRLKRKDGSYVSVEVRTFPVKIGSEMLTLGIARDMTERKRTEEELLEHQAKLKSLASQLSLTEERERHRLATDLHDQISQSLVISKIKLDQLRKSSSSDEFNEHLEDVSNCLGQIIDDTRTLTFDLSYPILYELGFEAAVAEWLTDQIQEKHGISTEFVDDEHQKPLNDDIRVLLFRNVRELLINVVKHAQANKVKVSIRKVRDNIHVSVEDDGVGFDPVEVTSIATKKAEFGLFSIRERLEQLGGLIEIDSEPGRGSKITMTAPLKNND